MEFIEGGSLAEILNNSKMDFSNISLFKKLCLDITLALSCMEKYNFYHLDIKPSNILYDKKNEKFLLIDFGTSNRQQKNKIF